MYRSHVAASFVCATLVAGPLVAQELSAYRDVHMGDNLQKVVASTSAANAEAVRLNLLERPGRDAARGREEAEAWRLVLEKARPANKAGFKP